MRSGATTYRSRTRTTTTSADLHRPCPCSSPVHAEFRPFFKFCFEFNREGTKKFLERDTALALLPLCIENRSKHTKLFIEFLETKPEDFKLNRDQWCSFLDFSVAVGQAPGFDGWNAEESSWPILLDEFVEFVMAKAKAGKKA